MSKYYCNLCGDTDEKCMHKMAQQPSAKEVSNGGE